MVPAWHSSTALPSQQVFAAKFNLSFAITYSINALFSLDGMKFHEAFTSL